MKSVRITLGVLLIASSTSAAFAADRFDDIREYIRAEMVKESVPSIAVAVAKDGKILWEEGFGWADREKRIPATEHTMYSLASISKPITATGLMTLVQAGKVDLDKPVNDYLGNAKLRARVGDARGATVRRVANHTSGLPLHYQFFYADEPYRRPPMDETILRYGNLFTEPGERMEYSNLGYGVLDYVIERVSGMSYAEYMRREVFIPLGLTRTSVDIGPGLEPFAATRYGDDGLPIPFYDFDHPGASAIFSSAHDLVRYGMFNLQTHLKDQKAILSDASIDAMQRDTGVGVGIGFFVGERNGYRVVEHSGGMGGVSTQMQLFPNEKLAIVVLSNYGTGLTTSAAERIAGKLLPKWKKSEPGEAWSEPPPFVTPSELAANWKGTLSTYTKDVPVELRFLPGGQVHMKFGGQPFALVNGAGFRDGVFSGEVSARIGTPDTERYDYVVRLSLRLRGDTLSGAVTAGDVYGPRVRNALTHWAELSKAATGQ